MSASNLSFGWDMPAGISDIDTEGPQPSVTPDNDNPEDSHYDDEVARSAMMQAYAQWCREHPLKGKWYNEP